MTPRLHVPGLRGELTRFGIVGLLSTAVHAAVYSVLAVTYGIGPLPATGIAFIFAFGISFCGHRYWTFAHRRGTFTISLLRFLTASLIGLCSNALIAWTLVDALHLPPLTPLGGVLLITPVLMFLLNRLWVFTTPQTADY